MDKKKTIKLPECGMFIGSPIYLDRGDYLFQHSGLYYSSWVSEDHTPEWYLEKVKTDNQGNLAVIWDGRATRTSLQAMADWLDLENLGYSIPKPDWENKKFLQPADWHVIGENMDRYGAGFYRLTQEADRLGLFTYSIYADATSEWAEKISAESGFLGINIGEIFSFDTETDIKPEFRQEKIRIDNGINLKTIADRFSSQVSNYFIDRKNTGWKRFLITSASFHLDFEIAAVVHDESLKPFLLINNYGKGKVYFLNSWEYPGALDINLAPGADRASKGLVGEIYKAIANESRGTVYISDDGKLPGINCEYIAFSYFPSSQTLCLLNIDYNRERRFFVHYNSSRKPVTLKAGEFRLLAC